VVVARYHSHRNVQLVGGVPQRLVLKQKVPRCPAK
jgi:hypothetical protein